MEQPQQEQPTTSKYDQKAIEKEIYDYWQENGIPQAISRQRAGKKKFFLLDGPPYANNPPHVGHVKTTACKDIWSRFKLMQGYDSLFLPGFDCHGLPTEVMVEKELGIKSKSEIEAIGVKKFDEMCLQKVSNTEKIWVEYYRALGAWRADYEPYFTYRDYYIESGWWTAKQLYEKGLMVEGLRSIHWCSHCETSLSGYEVSDSYKEMTDPSAYVKFPVNGKPGEYLLVWTTTPWTLPSNVAIAAKADQPYAKVEYKGEKYVLAKARVKAVFEELLKAKPSEYEVVEEFAGKELVGLKYDPLLDVEAQNSPQVQDARRVISSIKVMMNKKYKKHVAKEEAGQAEAKETAALSAMAESGHGARKTGTATALKPPEAITAAVKPEEAVEEYEDFVTLNEGTGLVHCAPGAGQSDNFVGKHYGLPAPSPVDVKGCFTGEVGPWKGMFVKNADAEIIKHLQVKGLVLQSGTVTHRTTLCWRCKTPLIFRLSRQWYLKVDPIKERMLSENGKVRWLPEFGKVKFANWVADREDWCISQQRYWGIPMPIWECAKCGRKKIIGSKKELVENAVEEPKDLSDLHRHTVDPIKLKCECGSTMERIRDIFNVWYDSGIAPWASLGYPFTNKELFEQVFPVDLITESQDQIRGWFDSLMFASVATFGHAPYKSVGLMGWVLDEKGEKMSKSLGNVVGAKDAIERVGADVIRFYYCWEVAPWEVQKFSFKSASEIQRFLSILYNSYTFFETYRPGNFSPSKIDSAYCTSLPAEDRFAISAVNSLAAKAASHMERFEFHLAGRELVSFVQDDFSRWYVKLVRDRVSGRDDKSKEQALSTMHYVLMRVAKLLAPMTPFICEKIYRNLKKLDAGEEWESVHFSEYPVEDAALLDPELEEKMTLAMKITAAANAARADAKIKLRWPVLEIGVFAPGDSALGPVITDLHGILESVTNAQKVSFLTEEPEGPNWQKMPIGTGSTGLVCLNTERAQAMMHLAGLREVSRAVQAARKKAGLVVSDRIALGLQCSDEGFGKYLSQKTKELEAEVGAKGIAFGQAEGAQTALDISELGLGTTRFSLRKV